MRTLQEINDQYKHLLGWTDKEVTDRPGHRYLSHCYEKAFAPYRDLEIDLVEVGSGYGGSLIIWHEWFSKARILGLEIADHSPEGKLAAGKSYPQTFLLNPSNQAQYPRASIRVCDAYTQATADSLGQFDIIIDDGHHTFDQWNKLINLYLPKLKPGGLMTIEDIGRRLSDRPNGFDIQELVSLVKDYSTEVVDVSGISGLPDSRVLLIRK